MGNALDLDTQLSCWETTVQKLERAFSAHQGTVCFTYGLLACFCGQHFSYSVLFWHSYRSSRWRRTKRAVGDVWSLLRGATRVAQEELPNGLPTFEEASDAAHNTVSRFQNMQEAFVALQNGDSTAGKTLSEELQGLQENMGLAQQLGNAANATVGELQPKRLLRLVLDLRHLFFENISAALSLGAHVGDATAKAVNRFAEPRMQTLIGALIRRSGDELVHLQEDANAGRWIRGAISTACSSLGIAASFYVESLVLPFVNARLGAELITCEIFHVLHHRGLCQQPPRATVLGLEWILCAGGLYFQLILGTGGNIGCLLYRFFFSTPKLPAFARLVLSMPLIAESWLRSAVAAHRLGLVGPTQLSAIQYANGLGLVVSDAQLDRIVANNADCPAESASGDAEAHEPFQNASYNLD